MKICLIVDDYLPYSIKVVAKMMHELGVEFAARGHEVTVVTPLSKLSTAYKIDILDRITVCRFRSGEIKNISKVRRAVNESLLSFIAWHGCKKFFVENPHDLIVYYSPTIFFGGLVGKLKRLWGAKSYLILRDVFPQWAIDNGLLKANSVITRYFRIFERINYDAADKIAVQSNKNSVLFNEMTGSNYNLDVLYNWSSTSGAVERSGEYRKRLGLVNKVVFFFGGNLGRAQDMMNIVRLSYRMRNQERAHFLVVGKGDEFDSMQAAINDGMAGSMTLLPSVSQEEYTQMLADFDVGLFTLHREHKTHNFPGKLLGYMLQGLPILGSINAGNDLKDLVEDAKAGLVSINGDDEEFYRNAVLLMDDGYRLGLGENARRLLSNTFSVSAAADKVLAICN